MPKGLVLKKQADLFTVEVEKELLTCVARKVLKKEGIFVGDKVEIDEEKTICKIEERRNILIRPPVANIDKMFIVVAPVPKPDLYMVDKLIIFCVLNSITPVLCVNKEDMDKSYCQKLEEMYKNIVKVLVFSTFDESVEKLKKEIKGVCVLAGQSAVGKSSIINALKKENLAEVDTFSKKIERGKQTTRVVSLFKFGKDKYLADTAGFSKLDESLLDLKEEEVKSYFPELVEHAGKCKFKSCLHLNLNDKTCGVCQAVKSGEINKDRYENYLKLYQNIKMLKKF